LDDGTPNPLYIAARNAAFTKAMTDARAQAAEFIAAEIETAMRQRQDVAEVVGNPALAKALTGLASDEAFVASKDLSELVRIAAQAELAGIYSAQSFESSDAVGAAQVAVVACVGPASAAAARGLARPELASAGQTVRNWFNSIPEQTLSRTLGVRFQRDESGALRPVAFGQARVPGAGGVEAAIAIANESANEQLGQLLGEAVASFRLTESIAKSVESSALAPVLQSATAYKEAVSSAAANRSGLERIGFRKVTEPLSGSDVVVVAVSTTSTAGGKLPRTSEPMASSASTDCPPVPDAMRKSVRQTRATGTGSSAAAAEAQALEVAIRREGASVKGNSLLERRFEEAMESVGREVREKVSSGVGLTSKVETFSTGFVHSFEVIEKKQVAGVWEVEICANLVQFDPKNPRFGLPPTAAVLPFACTPHAVRVGGNEVECDEVGGTCENALESVLSAAHVFDVLGERDLPQLRTLRSEIRARVDAGLAEEIEAVKLNRELTPDFVLIGRVVRAEFTGAPGQRPQQIAAGDNATATIEAKLVNVSSGEVVWSSSATETLKGRDILLVRAGRDLQDPSETSLSPLQLVVSRTSRKLAASLAAAYPAKATSSKLAQSNVGARSAGPIRIIRVASGMVTLDASSPEVSVGARLIVNLLVDVDLGNGRVEIDRDRLGIIEVVSVDGRLAKARVIEGDATAMDPKRCEAVRER
jgi:hypothetical protein